MTNARGFIACLLAGWLLLATGCSSASRQIGAGMPLPSLQAPLAMDPETGEAFATNPDEKEDILQLKNGDRITCEIKSLIHGIVTAKTDSMGTVPVEWVDVISLQSRFHFRIETADQETYYGSLAPSTDPGKMVVDQDGFQVILDMLDVVLIEKFEATILDRITGYINFGLNYSEATTIRQLNFAAGLQYKSKINVLSVDLSTILSEQDVANDTSRGDFVIDFKRFFTGGLYGYSNVGLQHNSEMGIALRTFLGLGVGVAPVRSSVMELSASAGLNGNNETASSGGDDQLSLEGVLSSTYQIFVFKSPKTDLLTTLTYFPNITETDRYRLAYDFRLRQELISDLFVDLKFYLSYDSDPPSATASNRDYGVIASLGYSW